MNDDYCLWMGDIDPRMDESIILNLFHFYNFYPLDIKLIQNINANKNKNYCFIYFKNIYEANDTLNQLNGKPIPNTPFKFKLSWANYATSETKIIFVGNLNPLIDDASLFNFFKSKYKSVSKAKIITENGQSKRYGFITLKKGNDYRKCLIEMNGVFFNGTNIRVKEYIKKNEDENNNNQSNLKENNVNNQLELNNNVNNSNANNDTRLLNTKNFNSNDYFSVSNSISRFNWINNENPINGIFINVNLYNNKNINSKNDCFNQSAFSSNYCKKNYCFNFSSTINGSMEYNAFINNDLNNISNISNTYNDNKNNNVMNNNHKMNQCKINKIQKLEILEELDEKTLNIKINGSLNKILEHYKESLLINERRTVSKLILYLIFV